MFEVLVSDLAADVVSLQEEIQAILDQQRELQAKLEYIQAVEAEKQAKLARVKAAQGKIEAAIALLTEGVAEIRDINSDELPHLEREVEGVVRDLFNGEYRVVVVPTAAPVELPAPTAEQLADPDNADDGAANPGVEVVEAESDIRPAADDEEWATVAQLNTLTIHAIRRLSTAKGVSGKGRRFEIAGRLAGKVTKAEYLAS